MKDTKNKGTVRLNCNISKPAHRKFLEFCKSNGFTIAGYLRKSVMAAIK